MRTARLVVWSLIGLFVLLALYVLMVRLSFGQVLDDIAMEGRKATRLRPRRLASSVVEAATPIALIVGGGALVVLADRWRGRVAALAVAVTLAGAGVLARVAKAELPRENMVSGSWVGPANTYPSGHTAVATALALMAVAVCPANWRARVAGCCAAALALHTVAMMGSGWHRPSDVVGGMSLAVALGGVGAAVVVRRWRGSPQRDEHGWFDRSRGIGIAVAASLVASLMWYLPIRLLSTGSSGESGFRSHLALALMSVTAAVLVVAAQARLTHAADAGRASVAGAPDDSGVSALREQ
jgi:membrane-associated phospholipid phosphatase